MKYTVVGLSKKPAVVEITLNKGKEQKAQATSIMARQEPLALQSQEL